MIPRRHFVLRLSGVFTTILAPAIARAATSRRHAAPVDATDPHPPTNEVAKLRLWKATDVPASPVVVRILPSGKAASPPPSPLRTEAVEYQLSPYTDVPAGYVIAEVTAPDKPAVRLPLLLTVGGQSTLFVRLQGNILSTEWIDDTPAPTENGCEFGIYNLLPASGDIEVNLGTILNVRLASIHSSLHLKGIKSAAYPVTINGSGASGASFRWNTDVDFNRCRKATLLIYPDPYGRIRPRVDAL